MDFSPGEFDCALLVIIDMNAKRPVPHFRSDFQTALEAEEKEVEVGGGIN